jgi:hypothetical protein
MRSMVFFDSQSIMRPQQRVRKDGTKEDGASFHVISAPCFVECEYVNVVNSDFPIFLAF